MTREEKQKAIDALKISTPITALTPNEFDDYIKTLNNLMDWLEQEPCEDCISRQAVMDALCDGCELFHRNGEQTCLTKCEEYHFLATLPSIQPKLKTGHWIIKEGREQGYDIAGIKTWYIQIMCDKCGFIKTAIEGHTGQYHFCPNCGAKMESEETE